MSKKLLNRCLMAIMMVVSMSAYALDKVNGVYQIGTAEDLKAFAELVNGGEAYANAVLTTDIDKGLDGTMIGRDGLDYQGTFDGRGHTITINLFSFDTQATAIFRNIGIHAIVQNLKVQGSITTDQKLAAGIAAWTSGVIRDCYVDVTVKSSLSGDATHGGIAAVGYRGALIENCLAKFVINGAASQNCGGVVGWASDPVNIVNCLVISDGSSFDLKNNGSNNIARNDGNLHVVEDLSKYLEDNYKNRPKGACFNNYVTNKWGDNKATTVVPYADLADGKICYQLNNDQSRIAWVQRIGTDPFPVPAAFGSGQVYASAATDCKGISTDAVTYSNTSSNATVAKHDFDEYGICKACGCFDFHMFEFDDPAKFDQDDRSILLGSADDIRLAEGWNRIANGFKLSMKMTNDIEISTDGQLIFTDDESIGGDFNGQGHTLTIQMDSIKVNNASFIPKMTGVFENVIMHGSISTSGQYAGSVTSHTYNDKAIIRNVFSDVNINCSKDGDNTSAGIVGVANSRTRLENVIYAGNVNGVEGGNTQCLAGICGWAYDNTITLANCAFLGTLTNAVGDSHTITRTDNYDSQTFQNVYSINEYGDGKDEHTYIKYTNTDGITNGELAFFLNGKVGGVERFYQKIGVDDYPMPVKKEGALVYAVAKSYRCDGQPLGDDLAFTNNPGSITIPPHTYDDGWCSVCGHMQEDFMAPVDGWFEIGTPGQFLWWSVYASTHLDASARLMADIDLKDYLTEDKATGKEYTKNFAQIGSGDKPFYGNFDGQHHIISNLIVDKPDCDGVGLISVMNSLPSKGFGGISDTDARAAEGVYIKNVTLDESCSLLGHGYVALVGMTASWAGHVNIKGVMMCGDVRANGGPNAAGVFGCVMGSACHVTIDNCGMVGNVFGPKENGSFSGWLGDWAEVTNCFAVGEVEGIENDDRYFARYGNSRVKDNIKNCYALHGTQVPLVTQEDFISGALAWKANGEQFRNPVWYQNLDEDMYPYPDPSHGNVIRVGDEYLTINEETLFDVIGVLVGYYNDQPDDFIAYTGAIEDYHNKIEALEDVTTVIGLADAMDSISASIAVIEASVEVYKQYQAKCEEVKTYLEEHDDLVGPDRDALEAYLNEDYIIIMEEHELPDSVIQQEIVRVEELLALAIKNGAVEPGRDLTNLFANADFHKDFKEGWTSSTGQYPNGTSTVTIDGRSYYGSEAWNTKFDIHQTVKGLKPGYYLVGLQGAFRPSNNRYSYNYVAQVYANNNVNYLQTVIEDYVSVDDTINGLTVYVAQTGGGNNTYDLAIYEDGFSTNGENGIIGYAVHGTSGMAVAGYAGRYKNYIIAKTEGDSLTIGVNNLGTNYGNDWTGFSSFNVIYAGEGEEAEEYVTTALESMLARANNILNIYRSDEIMELMEGEAEYPNYPVELKEALETAVAAAEAATGTEAKMKAVETLSQLFKDFYEARQAYLALHKAAYILETIELENTLSLVKKNDAGEWEETGELLLSLAETDVLCNFYDQMYAGYEDGSYSTEEAKEAATLRDPAISALVPLLDEDGYYLISTPKQLATFRVISSNIDYTVKAKLTADIDMTGIGMLPINFANYSYRGTFDGQGYAINNVYINSDAERTGLFNTLDGAIIKNLKLTGDYYSSQKFIGGIAGYTYNARIENCDVAVTINSLRPADEKGNPQDGTHGGLIGVNEGAGTVVENCLVNCAILGENTNSCGGVCGWATYSLTVNNTLILSSNYTVNTYSCNTVSRNPDNCTVNNVFYVTQLGDAKGTKVTAEQLASGEVCWQLNGSKGEDAHWFQTLGKEATPHLFGGSYVWKSGDEYVNRRPNIQLNAFASNLSVATNAEQIAVSYTLNAEAKNGVINFYAGNELKYAYVLKGGELMAGGHDVAIENSLLGVAAGTELTYALEITAMGVEEPVKIGEGYKVNSPYGLAVNNAPVSKGFGQIYVAESRPLEKGTGSIDEQKPGALFAFDATFQPINAEDGTPGFYGGLDIKDNKNVITISGDYKLDLKNVCVSKDGRLFIARASGNSTSSVWEADPADLNKPWTPIFTGGELEKATGIVSVGGVEQNRPAVAMAVEGEGENLKLVVLGAQRSDGKENFSDYKCFTYNLGTATSWPGAPSSVFEPLTGKYTVAPAHVGIVADNRGGLWYEQYPSTVSEDAPALKHFNTEGTEDYSNITTSTHGEAIAISADGSVVAIPMGNNKVVIYETNYVPMENGSIWLETKYSMSVDESQITGMAFDYANNLYITSSASKTLNRYAIPSFTGNKSVTPAAEGFVVGTESGDPDAIKSVNPAFSNVEGTIYNMAGQRVSRAQKGVYVVEGKKTLVK